MANIYINAKYLTYRVFGNADQQLIDDHIPYSVLALDDTVRENSLLVGNEDGTISMWNTLEFRKEDFMINGGASPCVSLKYVNDTLVTQEQNGIVHLFYPHQGYFVGSDLMHFDYSGIVKIDVASDKGGIIACPKRSPVVDIYSLRSHARIASLNRDISSLGEIAALKIIHLRGEPHFIVAYKNGELRIWDFRMLHAYTYMKHLQSVTALEFSEVTMDGIYGTRTGAVIFKIDCCGHLVRGYAICGITTKVETITIRQDNRIAALGTVDGQVHTIAWKSYRKISVLTEHTAEIHDLCFCKRSQAMMTAGNDGKISILNSYIIPKFVAF